MAKRLAAAAYVDGEFQGCQLSAHRRHLGQGAQAGEPEPGLPHGDGTDTHDSMPYVRDSHKMNADASTYTRP